MTEPLLRTSLKAYGTMDKREFERYPVEAPVKVQCPEKLEDSSEFLLKSMNISAGGIFLSEGHPDLEGKKLSLEIELPLDDSGTAGKMIVIRTTGAVIRSGSDGMAIRFNKDLDIKLQPGADSRLGE
jgi:hypothetical protein